MSERLIIFDTTLRDGEQSPGASMNTAEKVQLAIQLERLGVDVIEAGFPASSTEDLIAVKEIAIRIKKAQVAGLTRANLKDINLAWSALKFAVNPRLHLFLATSDLHMQTKLRLTREEVLKKAVEAVRYAKTMTDNVEFSAEDGSRSDKDFLCQFFAAVIEAGATTVNLPDTVGYAEPSEYGGLVRYVLDHTPGIQNAVFSVHCHNDLGLATANTLAAVKAGARQVEVTVNGIGERAGNTALEEVVLALSTRQKLYNVETGINLIEIAHTSRLVSQITGIIVQPNKAIVGANAFAHESGIHQDGMLKNRETYEIIRPETVGFGPCTLMLGRHSGKSAVRARLRTLGYELPDSQIAIVMDKYKALADKKKIIHDEDLEAIVAEHILRMPDIYELVSLRVSAGTDVDPHADIRIKISGQIADGSGYGNGPIDAVYNVLNNLVGNSIKLWRYSINALTGGTDAIAEVTAKIERFGLVAIGKGSDADVITASAKAFLNALNRIEARRQNQSFLGQNSANLGVELSAKSA